MTERIIHQGMVHREEQRTSIPESIEISTAFGIPESVLLDLNTFEVEARIGQGAFSRVYRARAPDGNEVAIKHYRSDIGSTAEYDKIRTAFQREVRSYRDLVHPQIPALVGVAATKTEMGRFKTYEPAIVMQWIPGETLADRLQYQKGFSPDDIRNIASQILDPLEFLHHGFSVPRLHRDIKPANLIRNPEGQLYMVDFGSIRDEIIGTLGASCTMTGTLAYVHQNQLAGEPSCRTDLYSVGRSLYALALGRELSFVEEFSAEKLAQTNVDSRTKQMIALLCDPALKGPQTVRDLRRFFEEPIEVNDTVPVVEAEEKSPDYTMALDESGGRIRIDTHHTTPPSSEERLRVFAKVSSLEEKLNVRAMDVDPEVELIRNKLEWEKQTAGSIGFLGGVTGLVTLAVTTHVIQSPQEYIPLLFAGLPSLGTYLGGLFLYSRPSPRIKSLEDLPAGCRLGDGFDPEVYQAYLDQITRNVAQLKKGLEFWITKEEHGVALRMHYVEKRKVLFGYDDVIGGDIPYGVHKLVSNLELTVAEDGRSLCASIYSEHGEGIGKQEVIPTLRDFDKPKDKSVAKALKALRKKAPNVYYTFRAMLPEYELPPALALFGNEHFFISDALNYINGVAAQYENKKRFAFGISKTEEGWRYSWGKTLGEELVREDYGLEISIDTDRKAFVVKGERNLFADNLPLPLPLGTFFISHRAGLDNLLEKYDLLRDIQRKCPKIYHAYRMMLPEQPLPSAPPEQEVKATTAGTRVLTADEFSDHYDFQGEDKPESTYVDQNLSGEDSVRRFAGMGSPCAQSEYIKVLATRQPQELQPIKPKINEGAAGLDEAILKEAQRTGERPLTLGDVFLGIKENKEKTILLKNSDKLDHLLEKKLKMYISPSDSVYKGHRLKVNDRGHK